MATANMDRCPPMSTEYNAQILKLDLPEQQELKNDAERCSADPGMLQSIGRAVDHQVRIAQADNPGFFALYTVAEANPPADLSDPSRANVVRTSLTGRQRLGTADEMKQWSRRRWSMPSRRVAESDSSRSLRTTERRLT